jgi:hypothetical protein
MPPMEMEESGLPAREVSRAFGEDTTEDDFAEADGNDVQDAVDSAGPAEAATAPRRRRRRRGRRGVHREDAFLGIDRLATEDIVGHEPSAAVQPAEEPSADQEDISLGEEITSIEIGGDEENGETAPASESEVQRKRRRRRRRGRGVKERSAGRARDDSPFDAEDDAETPRTDRPPRPAAHDEKRHDMADEDDELDEQEETGRPNKNLHREVTPWAEAIGFIVNANMEARARSPGRWGKSDRRN